jgi:uncharacterized membrane protein (UPF0127 family)
VSGWLKALAVYLSLMCISFTSAGTATSAEPAHLLQDFDQGQLLVVTDQRCILISTYVANSGQQRAQGLMHIRSMANTEGMIFLYPEPARISMWMKNTLIPLDMLFLKSDGRVAKIAANTKPMSETIINSDTDVTAVLELNAGAAQQLGIKSGDWIGFVTNPR